MPQTASPVRLSLACSTFLSRFYTSCAIDTTASHAHADGPAVKPTALPSPLSIPPIVFLPLHQCNEMMYLSTPATTASRLAADASAPGRHAHDSTPASAPPPPPLADASSPRRSRR